MKDSCTQEAVAGWMMEIQLGCVMVRSGPVPAYMGPDHPVFGPKV